MGNVNNCLINNVRFDEINIKQTKIVIKINNLIIQLLIK